VQLTERDLARTFIFCTDGDTSFTARSVQFLVDALKREATVGGVCGRIKPKGSGPLVWYQDFEYASGHWFQKVTEHALGTVLCCPGCFSMYRLEALNMIKKKYSGTAADAMDYLQMDMGEDRWMCTLMVRKGLTLKYVAAAVAETFAPEDFVTFFEQRRRWVPSTQANIYQLMMVGGHVMSKYNNINSLFMAYIYAMFLSTMLGKNVAVHHVLMADTVMRASSRLFFATSLSNVAVLHWPIRIVFTVFDSSRDALCCTERSCDTM
jgi:chitin synthase